MDNFDLTKFLAEGKLNEEVEALDRESVVDMAQMVADEFTEEDANVGGTHMIYKVGKVDGLEFELDTQATENTPADDAKYGTGEGWGGSFRIEVLPNGYEIRNSEKGGLVATMDMEDGFRMLSAAESRAEMGMEEGPVYPEDKHLMTPDEFGDDELDMDRYNDELDMDRYNDELDMKNMEESKMLDEGILDGIKDKIVAKVEKIKDKFSAEEIEKMKSAAEKAIGKSAEEFTMADFTMDNIKKVGKAINALNEEEQIEEGLGEKIQGIGGLLGMSAMFAGGHMAMDSASGGMEAFVAGAIAFVLSLIVGGIIKSRNNEAQEAPKSNKMKKSELKEMIKAAMLAEMEVEETTVYEAEEEDVEDVEIEDVEDVDVDVDVDADIEDAGEIDVEDDAKVELTGDKAEVSDNLEAALEAARKLGDEKLVDQIGNTITFFTRAHIVKEGDVVKDEAEMELEEVARMKKLAGLK